MAEKHKPSQLSPFDSGLMEPKKWGLEVKQEALRLLAAGITPGQVCKTLGVPRGTLGWWREQSPGFRSAYAHALQAGAEHLAAETVELADQVEPDRDQVAKVREQIRARQWLAARYDPDQYGDRQRIDQNVEVQVRTTRFKSLLGERTVRQEEAQDASFEVTRPAEGEEPGPGAAKEE